MKSVIIILSITLSFIIAAQDVSAANFAIEKTPAGTVTSVQGEAFAPKSGNLLGTNLTIFMDEDVVEIKDLAPDKSRITVVAGKSFNMHIKNETNEASRLEGFCFFNSGDRLPAFIGGGADTADLILTSDGQRFAGKITSVEKGLISLTEYKNSIRLIRARDIRSIASGHVYKLSALIFADSDLNSASVKSVRAKILRFDLDQTMDDFMTASGKKRMETAIDAAGYNKWQRGALIGASVLITGAAIAVPVAVAVSVAGRHQKGLPTQPESTPLVEIQR